MTAVDPAPRVDAAPDRLAARRSMLPPTVILIAATPRVAVLNVHHARRPEFISPGLAP